LKAEAPRCRPSRRLLKGRAGVVSEVSAGGPAF
jgi:hypothetical protein